MLCGTLVKECLLKETLVCRPVAYAFVAGATETYLTYICIRWVPSAIVEWMAG